MNIWGTIKHKAAAALLCCAFVLLALPAGVVRAASYTPEADKLTDTYVVMDAATGQVLVANGPTVAQDPASITKIVTRARVQKAINEGVLSWDTQTTMSQSAMDALIPDASTAGLVEGEVVSVRDLVQLTQIRSANEAANALAELLGGSIAGFADMMNAQVAALGLTGTHFTNPSGLPDKNHYTTAADMGQLTRWAMSVPGFNEIFVSNEYTMPPTNMYNGERVFAGSNAMLYDESDYYYEGIIGAKSGYTDAASFTLVTAAEKDGLELICVVMRTEMNDDKYIATTELFDYCFANFTRVDYNVEGVDGAKVPVYGGGDSLGDITVEGGNTQLSFLLHRSLSMDDVAVEYNVPESYVIGQEFAPSVSLTIGDGSRQYAEAVGIPLSYSGLEELFTANTNYGWSAQDIRVPPDYSGAFNFIRNAGIVLLLALALAVLIACMRAVYVQYRRRKVMQSKLLEQRTTMAQKRAHIYRQPQVAPRAPAARGVKNPAANGRRPAARQAVHLTVVTHQRSPVPGRSAPRANQR